MVLRALRLASTEAVEVWAGACERRAAAGTRRMNAKTAGIRKRGVLNGVRPRDETLDAIGIQSSLEYEGGAVIRAEQHRIQNCCDADLFGSYGGSDGDDSLAILAALLYR